MWTVVRDWYIAGIGLLLIAGGLALAAHQSSPPAAVSQAAGPAQGQAATSPAPAARTAQQAVPVPRTGLPRHVQRSRRRRPSIPPHPLRPPHRHWLPLHRQRRRARRPSYRIIWRPPRRRLPSIPPHPLRPPHRHRLPLRRQRRRALHLPCTITWRRQPHQRPPDNRRQHRARATRAGVMQPPGGSCSGNAKCVTPSNPARISSVLRSPGLSGERLAPSPATPIRQR